MRGIVRGPRSRRNVPLGFGPMVPGPSDSDETGIERMTSFHPTYSSGRQHPQCASAPDLPRFTTRIPRITGGLSKTHGVGPLVEYWASLLRREVRA